MRKIIPVFLVLMILIVIAGCKSKSSGPDTPQAVTIDVTLGSNAPLMTTTTGLVWNSVPTTTFPISMTGNTTNVRVQAMKYNDTLYLRLKWADSSHDVWLGSFKVIDLNFARHVGDTIVQFSGPDTNTSVFGEDQVVVMFDSLTDGRWDCLNWRALTTDSAFLAEGINFNDEENSFTIDSGNIAAGEWNFLIGEYVPWYIHKDTCEYTGFTLFKDNGLRMYSSNDMEHKRCWELNQGVPGWIIDSTLYRDITPLHRYSRWETRAISSYSVDSGYTVVMARPMNTGFSDDVVLTGSIKTKICIINKLKTIAEVNNRRAFTSEFYLKF